MTRMLRRLTLVLTVAGVACAHVQAPPPVVQNQAPPPPQDRVIRFKPVIIQSSPAEAQLTDLNDEELFAIGQNAMAAGDNQKAALHFERLADAFPNSKHRAAALHYAGLMMERMKDYAGALDRFVEAMKAYGPTQEGAESQFKAADEYFFLNDYDGAVKELEPLTTATYLTVAKQMEAREKLGVVLYTAGKLDDAEKIFRVAFEEMKDGMKDDYHDGYLPSQAQFYLAEIYRTRFLDVKLDPTNETKEQLMQDLEYKAQMLLSAQGHYLMCIRVGHPEWATASGFRVGELYQLFYEQLMAGPTPKDVAPDAIPVYKEELHNRIRNLITKAISTYEKTLQTAERVGATNPFVAETREQLEKLKTLLANEKATATEAAPPTDHKAPPAEQKKPGQS